MADNVTTWADGYGRWWASVPLSGSRHRDAPRARRAIVAELEARGGPCFDASAVRVERAHVTNHGTAKYREK